MDQGPLVTEQVEAGERLAQEVRDRIGLKAAFWLKDAEDGRWTLYLATEHAGGSGPVDAFDEVLDLLVSRRNDWPDPFLVRVVGTDDPAAKEVLEIHRKYPRLLPRRLKTQLLGGRYVEDSYLYAAPVAAAG